MKGIMIIVLLILCTGRVTAQVQQGTKVVRGGFLYFNYTFTKDRMPVANTIVAEVYHKTEQKGFSANPGLGYFIKDNLELGVSFGYHTRTEDSKGILSFYGDEKDSYYTMKNLSYSVGSYIRKYFFLSDKFALVAAASVDYSKQKNDLQGHNYFFSENRLSERHSDYRYRYHTFSAALSPGIAFFVTSRLNLSATLGGLTYTRHTQNVTGQETNENESNSLRLNLAPENFYFGMSYFFGR